MRSHKSQSTLTGQKQGHYDVHNESTGNVSRGRHDKDGVVEEELVSGRETLDMNTFLAGPTGHGTITDKPQEDESSSNTWFNSVMKGMWSHLTALNCALAMGLLIAGSWLCYCGYMWTFLRYFLYWILGILLCGISVVITPRSVLKCWMSLRKYCWDVSSSVTGHPKQAKGPHRGRPTRCESSLSPRGLSLNRHTEGKPMDGNGFHDRGPADEKAFSSFGDEEEEAEDHTVQENSHETSLPNVSADGSHGYPGECLDFDENDLKTPPPSPSHILVKRWNLPGPVSAELSKLFSWLVLPPLG